MKSIRTLAIENMIIPANIQHGHLAAHERIDTLDCRVDYLNITHYCEYLDQGSPLPHKMTGILDYLTLCNKYVANTPKLSGPIENLLDDLVDETILVANRNQLCLQHIQSNLQRIGVNLAYPILGICHGQSIANSPPSLATKFDPHNFHGIRTAGIHQLPLIIRVDNEWLHSDRHNDDINFHYETVLVSFHGTAEQNKLDQHYLNGLYNYTHVYNYIQKLQNSLVDGPIEQLCDVIMKEMEQDPQHQHIPLLNASVTITRNYLSRFNITVGLFRDYEKTLNK